jgi:2-polyprenyl-6-hydroxyphenyl methylase/3-demethylubiquinone-9 3-methyltransferase
MMLFTTLLQPSDIGDFGANWWYAAPRNGHVSLYSHDAMHGLMRRLGMRWRSCVNNALHVAYRKKLPRFARHLEGSVLSAEW